jgi:hypothetical protein
VRVEVGDQDVGDQVLEVVAGEALSEAELLFRIEVFLALASLRQWAMRVRTGDNGIDVRMLGSESLATVVEEGDA